MKVTEIDKMIKAIDGIDFNASEDFIKTQILEVKNMLVYERQCAVMEEKGGKTSLLTAIKTILSGAKSMGRESLSTVQHSEDGKPFICDGYVAIIWDKDIPELKAFEQAPAERSIKLNSIMPESRSQAIESAISDDDKLILNNLAKYVKLHKAETATPIIKIFNKYYNAAYLKRVFDIVGAADMQSIYYLKQEGSYPNFIYKDNLTAAILPCRVLEEKDKQKIESQTLEFIKLLKN